MTKQFSQRPLVQSGSTITQTQDDCDNLEIKREGQRGILIQQHEMDNFPHFIGNSSFPGRRNPLFIWQFPMGWT